MKTQAITTIMTILLLASIIAVPIQANGTIINYGDVTLSGGFQKGHFCDVWDLTAGDLVISFIYDARGLVDDAGCHAWAELGIRAVGYGDFNPTWMSEGAGVWLATDYDWTANTFDPDTLVWYGPPWNGWYGTLDLDDKLILQKGGGMGEGAYNLPSTPPNPWANHRVWWDRDGVDPWQNPATANTGGIYQIVITLHATSETTGTAYMNIRGLDQGFETDGNWNTIELTPAGMTFTGDMKHMQVFYGLYGYGATHTVVFEDITVTGHPHTLNLQFQPSSDPIVAINSPATLTVHLKTDDNVPVPGETVTFSSDPAGLTFTNVINPTDSSGCATVTATTGTAGIYLVTATVCGTVSDTWTLVVYDPSSLMGMTAGGGWYCPLDDGGGSMAGTASFGFVAKNIKGGDIGSATGNLEFQYHVEDKLNLKSTSITWLVVSGSNAQFKGTVTLNGVSGYYFRVIAQDNGEPGVDKDTFAIKIWFGDPDNGGALIHSSHNVLDGGNILVRTK